VARQSVDAKREASKTRASEREKKDEAYLERAKANRERALDFRVRARQSKEAFIAERKEKVKSERCATGGGSLGGLLAAETKARILRMNRKSVAESYKHRFVSKKEEQEWEASTLRRLGQPLGQQSSARGALVLRSARLLTRSHSARAERKQSRV